MSRRDASRLGDIVDAIEAVKSHLTRVGFDDGWEYRARSDDVKRSRPFA